MGRMAQTCEYILNGNVIHECIYEVFETNMIKAYKSQQHL